MTTLEHTPADAVPLAAATAQADAAPRDRSGRFRRMKALIRKETLQIVRDPSSLVIAVILPILLLFLFGFGVSFDVTKMRIGLVIEQPTPDTARFEASLANTQWFRVQVAHDRRAFLDDLTASRLEGVIVLSGDFSERIARGDPAAVQIITDGTDPNTASLVNGYAQGAWQSWLAQLALSGGKEGAAAITTDPRFWFNPELESRRFLVPGSIALILMMIGSLLTALVVAREWERGTIEALLATPASVTEFLVGKVVPNFVLGLCAMAVSVLFAIFVFDVPMRGSVAALLAASTAFLLVALSSGLLISSLARSQFLASQIAMITAFLPALFFSGFIFEISSMPGPLQAFSALIPAKYYVRSLQTIFLAGDVAAVLVPSILILAFMSLVLMLLTARFSKMRLD
ncbi:ABC transporter permease [Rhodomicrobium sp. Az07]|uniref:ABC transporter permease n=1 Tax=Rhodomicrobium sp. Az07 TaxID=2839034 RepID=UPI001BE5A60A|nr:ABC transporter permease [Rhodomicrobium sp. Az07]MBT3071707.1 ABC transporter permease [Rhodomicrobium sp. Az07]